MSGRDWIARIEELRQQGLIDEDAEAALVRHLSDRRAELEVSMTAMVPEYRRRVAEDGREPADEWLAAQARELGEADARATRELLDGLQLPQA